MYGAYSRVMTRSWDENGSWAHHDEERFLFLASHSLNELRMIVNARLTLKESVKEFYGEKLRIAPEDMRSNSWHREPSATSTAHGYIVLREMPPGFKL